MGIEQISASDWIKDHQWYIDAIANETPVIFINDDICHTSIPDGFVISDPYPYIDANGDAYEEVMPAPQKELVYLSHAEQMQWLIDHNYIIVRETGEWIKDHNYIIVRETGEWINKNPMICFTPEMWEWCGKPVPKNNGVYYKIEKSQDGKDVIRNPENNFRWYVDWMKEVYMTIG